MSCRLSIVLLVLQPVPQNNYYGILTVFCTFQSFRVQQVSE
jgi:hypothetical protein